MKKRIALRAAIVTPIVKIAAGRNYAGSLWIYLMFFLLANLLVAESISIQLPGQIHAWIVAYFLIGLLMARLSSKEGEPKTAKTSN